jgi:hypothetical protein
MKLTGRIFIFTAVFTLMLVFSGFEGFCAQAASAEHFYAGIGSFTGNASGSYRIPFGEGLWLSIILALSIMLKTYMQKKEIKKENESAD